MKKKIIIIAVFLCVIVFLSGFVLGRITKTDKKKYDFLNAYKMGWSRCIQRHIGSTSDFYDSYIYGKQYNDRFNSNKEAFFAGYYDAYVFIFHVELTGEEKQFIDEMLDREISLYFGDQK